MRQTIGSIIVGLLIASFGVAIFSSPITASTQTYTVTFMEHGLPNGTAWSVKFGGQVKNSTTDQISFQVKGTSYLNYSIPDVGKYIPTPSQGSFLVDNSTTINVTFALPFVKIVITKLIVVDQSTGTSVTQLEPGNTYQVGVSLQNQGNTGTFVEINETVLMNGKVVESDVPILSIGPGSTASATFLWTPNTAGVYTFLVHVQASPNISESASYPLYVGVSPVKTYNVTFTEMGLPAGTQWSVEFNGEVESSMTPTITFQVSNGTYTYYVNNVSGFLPNVTSGKVKVNGTTNVMISFLPLIFKPVSKLLLSYDGEPISQLETNTTYSVIASVTNVGNTSGQGYLLLLGRQGTVNVIDQKFNYTLRPGQTENFTEEFMVNSTTPLTITLTLYTLTPQGAKAVYNSTSQLPVIQKVTNTTKSQTSNTTTTTTTTPNTTKPTTTTNVSTPSIPTQKSSNTLLYVAIAVVVVVIIAIVLLVRRR
ncbi:CARDB domain-containing protein [Metallosphaera hakonensis]|uniref:CARDB domain-containing protein n=1 Tax=Metallosphaera hakonensis JCM 8857 = DSM 7519 TaxID=1293036 RepID=A0A2U9IRJ0_9CREN|nr:CARDB domain-containing protein [Metallosphaera hakonensis]AWR98587.1 hypothetical protein DFR87_01450 [Metallosphaera hakonensis JCM 8857 = DSM 7519]